MADKSVHKPLKGNIWIDKQILKFDYGGQNCAQNLKWSMWIYKEILNFGYRGQNCAQIFKMKYVDLQANSQFWL